MKQFVLLMCLLVTAFAAPAPGSESGEVSAHANEALRLMETYRLFQQSGAANPFLPAADAPARPAFSAVVNPAPLKAEDDSEEETEGGNTKAAVAPAASLNSDEAEEAEEVEEAEAEPAVVETAPAEPPAEPAAEPGAALEPAVPADVVPVDGVAVNVPPVDIVPVDSAPSAPGAAADKAVPAADAGADLPAM